MMKIIVTVLRMLIVLLVIPFHVVSAQDPYEDEVLIENVIEPEGNFEFLPTTVHSQNSESGRRIKRQDEFDDAPPLSQNENSEVVQTTGGPVIGTKTKTQDGVEVSVYYGIPYAAAPVGPLRFRPPVPVAPWKMPLKAVNPRIPLCYQQLPKVKGMEMAAALVARPWTEDCLTLSIWAPNPKPNGAPVLVNIHGGAFILGSSVMFIDGSNLVSSGVLLVSLNYRLGVFGFFGLGLPEAPGNVGLMDQTLALQWVKENIAAFGGDPSRVTLIGVSAGGASVGYHLLSPMSTGLFSAAIAISGSPSNPWAIKEPEETVKMSNALLASLGCTNSDVSQNLDCLRKRQAQDILEAIGLPPLLTGDFFVPTVDGQFMREHPEVCLEAGRIASPVPVIVGTAENEGSMFVAMGLENQDGRVFRRDFRDVIQDMDKKLTPLQVKALDVLYTNWSNPDDPYLLRDAAIDFSGDYLFACGVNKLAESMARTGSPVYRYVFGHPFGFGPVTTLPWMGAIHGGDVIPIFVPDNALGNRADDLTVSKKFRQRIINFVKNRDPNEGTEDNALEDVPWPQYDVRHGAYTHIAAKSRIQHSLRARECRIIDQILPLLTSANKNC